MKNVKKIIMGCFILVFLMSLASSISVEASEGEVTSEVTIGFSEKTLKDKGKKNEAIKASPSITNHKIDSNNSGKKFYSALPKTGEVLYNPLIYVGLVLILSALSYKVYLKRRENK